MYVIMYIIIIIPVCRRTERSITLYLPLGAPDAVYARQKNRIKPGRPEGCRRYARRKQTYLFQVNKTKKGKKQAEASKQNIS